MRKGEGKEVRGIEGHLAGLAGRLDSILGKGRIPRSEKKAKAEAAMEAVDDLVGAIDEEIAAIDKGL